MSLSTEPQNFAILVAAGKGLRAGGEVAKQFQQLDGRVLLGYSLQSLLNSQLIHRLILVIHKDDVDKVKALPEVQDPRVIIAFGGATRQESVRLGLEAVMQAAGLQENASLNKIAPSNTKQSIVLIHDAARPFLSQALITRAIEAAFETGAAVPVLPVADTIIDLHNNPVPRETLRIVQTPQSFRLVSIHAAHQKAHAAGKTDFTDDAGIAAWAGITPKHFMGDANTFKITEAADFQKAEAILHNLKKSGVKSSAESTTQNASPQNASAHHSIAAQQQEKIMQYPDIRTATGYDVHAFGEGDHVWLGGIKIPHSAALIGHSDADPLLHALTDALLGCLADGDIGVHFPPSDMKWKGASSDQFLAFAVEKVKARGGKILHLDGTIVCEAPKIGPHRAAMQARIAAICGLPLDRVGLKATTSERLGFTGRGEGIAALATATIVLG